MLNTGFYCLSLKYKQIIRAVNFCRLSCKEYSNNPRHEILHLSVRKVMICILDPGVCCLYVGA